MGRMAARGALVVGLLLSGAWLGEVLPTEAEVQAVPGGGGAPTEPVEVPPAVCSPHPVRGPVRCTTWETEYGRPLRIARADWAEAGRQADAFWLNR